MPTALQQGAHSLDECMSLNNGWNYKFKILLKYNGRNNNFQIFLKIYMDTEL